MEQNTNTATELAREAAAPTEHIPAAIGRIVLFALSRTVTRPMIVVDTFADGKVVSGALLFDGKYDEQLIAQLAEPQAHDELPLAHNVNVERESHGVKAICCGYVRSVSYDPDGAPGTWRYHSAVRAGIQSVEDLMSHVNTKLQAHFEGVRKMLDEQGDMLQRHLNPTAWLNSGKAEGEGILTAIERAGDKAMGWTRTIAPSEHVAQMDQAKAAPADPHEALVTADDIAPQGTQTTSGS